jgi:hypothetical protein
MRTAFIGQTGTIMLSPSSGILVVNAPIVDSESSIVRVIQKAVTVTCDVIGEPPDGVIATV